MPMLVRVFCIDIQSSVVLMLRYTLVSPAEREVKTSPIASSVNKLFEQQWPQKAALGDPRGDRST